ncbi:phosphodiester glycosidase family protein [Bacillus sp. ISL-7]|uniref:phosphodiester glycosidase family protein n=1 Tax=Bacillus sp. ISL-7 TaxID=2819136 RepID=UPI00203662DB|nr:phosphodiester glycosidase family protein [Bacillus sp. ISL-7]
MVETDVNEYLYPFICCYYQKALNRKSNLSIRKLRKKEKGKGKGKEADLGCKETYNLDGGGSSTMYLKGRVVNNPLGKGQERGVSDILYFDKI